MTANPFLLIMIPYSSNFNKFLKLNKKRKIVCVQSGMRLLDLVNILKIKGYKLSSIPGGEKISVGGAIAANVIGKTQTLNFHPLVIM